jgi:hypothetical protein
MIHETNHRSEGEMPRILRAYTLDLAVLNDIDMLTDDEKAVLDSPSEAPDSHGLTPADYERLLPPDASPPPRPEKFMSEFLRMSWERRIEEWPWTALQKARLTGKPEDWAPVTKAIMANRKPAKSASANASRLVEALLRLGIQAARDRAVQGSQEEAAAQRTGRPGDREPTKKPKGQGEGSPRKPGDQEPTDEKETPKG